MLWADTGWIIQMIKDERTFTELMIYETFQDRLEYLKLNGSPFKETFGWQRNLNQNFYKSKEWRNVRGYVIHRDRGRDMGIHTRPIMGRVVVHHMNPISPNTLAHEVELALDPEFLVAVSIDTHQYIHYGREEMVILPERIPGDTKLW